MRIVLCHKWWRWRCHEQSLNSIKVVGSANRRINRKLFPWMHLNSNALAQISQFPVSWHRHAHRYLKQAVNETRDIRKPNLFAFCRLQSQDLVHIESGKRWKDVRSLKTCWVISSGPSEHQSDCWRLQNYRNYRSLDIFRCHKSHCRWPCWRLALLYRVELDAYRRIPWLIGWALH